MSDTNSPFTTTEQRASYGIGRQMGGQLVSNPIPDIDADSVAQGLLDALNGKESRVNPQDIQAAFDEMRARMASAEKEQAGDVGAEGEAFLKENASKEGVQVTASGLQYEVIETGTGATPTADSTVRTHYHGTLIDGTVFDSSVQRGEPLEFPVNGVIAGWTEALKMMPVGSKWRLFIPHQLAYGERGAGGVIGPYQALVFEVELLAIVS